MLSLELHSFYTRSNQTIADSPATSSLWPKLIGGILPNHPAAGT